MSNTVTSFSSPDTLSLEQISSSSVFSRLRYSSASSSGRASRTSGVNGYFCILFRNIRQWHPTTYKITFIQSEKHESTILKSCTDSFSLFLQSTSKYRNYGNDLLAFFRKPIFYINPYHFTQSPVVTPWSFPPSSAASSLPWPRPRCTTSCGTPSRS